MLMRTSDLALRLREERPAGGLRTWAGELPLLLLMVALTASGLWVLAQPVSPSRLM